MLHLRKDNENSGVQTLATLLEKDIRKCVSRALDEDINSGDITAELISPNSSSVAEIISREKAVVCGISWVNEVLSQLDPSTEIEWFVKDGDFIKSNQILATIKGFTRILLTAERTILNFLQTLSGTATSASRYAGIAKNSSVQILDTRKTIPGLRLAQKYAVSVGGCKNHRIGLFDSYLIKENHIKACGGITSAVRRAREIRPDLEVQVEVENLNEFHEAINASADIILIDNFSAEEVNEIGELENSATKIEISGNINEDNLAEYLSANKIIDRISCGSLTKYVKSVDLSMRLMQTG
mgnify:FL=1|tara:strand:- start:50 stop:943 length:894 start_codon:yes stop_codon:yes gene_type:complete